jgi:hypothetical protein
VPLGDGDKKDESLCVDVLARDMKMARSGPLPRCMDMIAAYDVIRAVELYFRGGAIQYLTPAEAKLAAKVVTR